MHKNFIACKSAGRDGKSRAAVTYVL